eukprot:gene12205-13462_t
MYPELTSFLNASLTELQKGEFILIEDDKVDGSFLLHHFISVFLKGDCNVLLIGFSQALVHYNSIGKKLGLNLNSAKENNQFVFMDGMSFILKSLDSEHLSQSHDLKKLYGNIVSTLEEMNKMPTLLILDDINVLLNAGIDAESVADFMHHCNCLTNFITNPLSFLALLHCDSDVIDDDVIYLRNQLKYYATIQFNVRGLETGYSKDVHGE